MAASGGPTAPQPSSYLTSTGTTFIPTAFASTFLHSTIVQIAQQRVPAASPAAPWVAGLVPVNELDLVQATQDLAPPSTVPYGGDLYQVLMGVIALRAATPSFEPTITDAPTRFARAHDWFCQNFKEFIWWDCDSKP